MYTARQRRDWHRGTIRREKLFNVRSKADVNQLYLPREKVKTIKPDMLRSFAKQSRESVESVMQKKRTVTVGRICRKGRF